MIFAGGATRRAAADLYGRAVEAARAPVFYQGYGVADTIEGRYEMIVLHVVLVMLALGGQEKAQARLAQALVDFMAADFDRSIRELGVGDLSVSRFMKRLGEGLFGRAAAYQAALQGDGEPLADTLRRNVYNGVDPGAEILVRLADYVHIQRQHLADQPIAAIAAGQINFLPPRGPES